MKILIVSMRSIHTIRWVSQLENSGHEVHWFDILNGGYISEWAWVTQHTNWRYKFGDFKGRFFLKKHLPKLHLLFENNVEKEFEKLVNQIKPDAVHSFALHIAAYPILSVMNKYPSINWIYSSWGSDLFFHKEFSDLREKITKVLPHIDFYFSDCKRDCEIVRFLGFNGTFLGVFPGGGGYDLKQIDTYVKPYKNRDVLLIKGYQRKLGRCIQVLEALKMLKGELKECRIIVFGAHQEVIDYIHKNDFDTWGNFTYHKNLAHEQLLKLMGQAKIYIGNNISDGMPNTLLEAICAGAYPIQSNPGGATAEIINTDNGALINDSENVEHIFQVLKSVLEKENLVKGSMKNLTSVRTKLEYEKVKSEVLLAYNKIENKR
ncbi:glycosyltransferase family 4 protein [Ulvibacter litoralis]|uniref:Glycosyl transferase 4-like n=1 Tax=Ulvibacter litoralis TaxID=227084 RepID=A0A1G7GVB9_9FLAO|nr:glycosyltransferase family 4 protein [Ulvibacter litoralis]GHC59957.1 capsular polysaccharide biosynthesis protein [Ulvibacter litoralis]SDE92106.1 Glycosyl transferase 4-like [Ulvibacter litoralis]